MMAVMAMNKLLTLPQHGVPALQGDSVRLWPFDGKLASLFRPGETVIAETYPAQYYSWFAGDRLRNKTDIKPRMQFGTRLLAWARGSAVVIEPHLVKAIEAGFPDGEDDAFDAVVGLFGMLQVVLGRHPSGEPNDETVREVEGWILGRESQTDEPSTNVYSANTDGELRDWLRWASEGGDEAPSFIRAIAEAAFLADSADYALLRPVLLELKRQRPRTY
jgi:hypothetical protein